MSREKAQSRRDLSHPALTADQNFIVASSGLRVSSLCLCHLLTVLGPTAEPVLVRLLRHLVADPDFYIAVCVAAVLFFDRLFLRERVTTDLLVGKVPGISRLGSKLRESHPSC